MRAVTMALALVLGCGSPVEPAVEDEASASPDAMCPEHGVLEALCTLCNPALVPVFRARGDYCEEHRLPESICPICHPERGGRPEAAIDDAPADGLRVRLESAELAARAGIQTVEIEAAPPSFDLHATAHIVYDATRVAQINARSPGVVRAIHADVGARVAAGDPLLAIASADVAADRTRVTAARSRLQIAEANLARREGLGDIVSERDRLEARRERDEARAELAALSASLEVVGGARRGAEYVLTAPIAGVVTQRTATIGSYVDGREVLVEVVDPSRVWAEIDVNETDVARVRPGDPVRVVVGALGERVFEGAVDYLAPAVDPHTRTVPARTSLANDDGALRAQMFATATIATARPAGAPAWRIPRGAVQRARGAALVFVRIAPELYEVRRVEVVELPGDEGHVEVRGRLEEGDRVVLDGAFLLRTETLRESIGAGCCETEGH